VLKVIVANPTIINAYKAGVPGNGEDGVVAAFLRNRLSGAGHRSD
jgi:hypothetical protein